jgi:hypothetical protein
MGSKNLMEKVWKRLESTIYHANMNLLLNVPFGQHVFKFPETNKKGKCGFYYWLKWAYKLASNEDFMNHLCSREDTIFDEN